MTLNKTEYHHTLSHTKHSTKNGIGADASDGSDKYLSARLCQLLDANDVTCNDDVMQFVM